MSTRSIRQLLSDGTPARDLLEARLECVRLALEQAKFAEVKHYSVENQAANLWRFVSGEGEE